MGWVVDRSKDGESMSQQRESEKMRKISQASQVGRLIKTPEINSIFLICVFVSVIASLPKSYFRMHLVFKECLSQIDDLGR